MNGPNHFGVNFAFWWGSFRWDVSSHTCWLSLYCEAGGPFWSAVLFRAQIAFLWFWVIISDRVSTRGFVVSGDSSVLRRGLYPSKIWFGDSPVVTLTWLLCTAVASASQLVHPFGSMDVMSCRYCSTHWFFLSDSLSVWGWNTVDRLHSIPSLVVRAFPKWDVNLGSLSLIIREGSPNHRYTWSMS